MKKSLIHVNPSQEEIDACAPFFPESELSDIIHAATCLYADAILITNDHHFIKNQTARGHPTLKDGVCFGPRAQVSRISETSEPSVSWICSSEYCIVAFGCMMPLFITLKKT